MDFVVFISLQNSLIEALMEGTFNIQLFVAPAKLNTLWSSKWNESAGVEIEIGIIHLHCILLQIIGNIVSASISVC